MLTIKLINHLPANSHHVLSVVSWNWESSMMLASCAPQAHRYAVPLEKSQLTLEECFTPETVWKPGHKVSENGAPNSQWFNHRHLNGHVYSKSNMAKWPSGGPTPTVTTLRSQPISATLQIRCSSCHEKWESFTAIRSTIPYWPTCFFILYWPKWFRVFFTISWEWLAKHLLNPYWPTCFWPFFDHFMGLVEPCWTPL